MPWDSTLWPWSAGKKTKDDIHVLLLSLAHNIIAVPRFDLPSCNQLLSFVYPYLYCAAPLLFLFNFLTSFFPSQSSSALLDEPLLLAVRLFQQNGLGNSDTTPSNAQEHSVVAAAASASATNTATTPEPFHGSHASRTQIAAALERLDEAITQQHDAAAQQQEQSRRYADNIKATTEAAYHLDLDPDDPFVNAEVRHDEGRPKSTEIDKGKRRENQKMGQEKEGNGADRK